MFGFITKMSDAAMTFLVAIHLNVFQLIIKTLKNDQK